MTVLFLLENSVDHPAGGTDISSFHLASSLRQKGVHVVEWSPYRTRKLPFLYTWLFILPFLVLKTLLTAKKERVDLIHIQGKYLASVGVIAARMLHIPVVATIRDYIVCCPIGLCLFDSINPHNFNSFVIHEIPHFFEMYHKDDSLTNRFMRMILLVRAWFVTKWLRYWVRKADTVVAVSAYVASVLKKYNIASQIIYNCFDVSKYQKMMKTGMSRHVTRRRDILFVGKDSYGKGSDLFDAMSKNKEFSSFRFVKLITGRWTPYEDVLRAMRDALVTIVPSRWQEPFGRVALESLICGTPVVGTNRGGLPEIVNLETGILTEPDLRNLTFSLSSMISKNKKFRDALRKNKRILQYRFSTLPTQQYQELYQRLLDRIGNA